MSKPTKTAGSLRNIFDGFRRITKQEQLSYLKYLSLVIERNPNDKSLIRLKRKLEKYVENSEHGQQRRQVVCP